MMGVKGKGVAGFATVQGIREVLQLRRMKVPVVQHLLQGVGDAGRIMRGSQIAGDDDQLAVTRSVFVGGKFHKGVRGVEKQS